MVINQTTLEQYYQIMDIGKTVGSSTENGMALFKEHLKIQIHTTLITGFVTPICKLDIEVYMETMMIL